MVGAATLDEDVASFLLLSIEIMWKNTQTAFLSTRRDED